METSEEEAVSVEDDDEADDFARPFPRDDKECAYKVNRYILRCKHTADYF